MGDKITNPVPDFKVKILLSGAKENRTLHRLLARELRHPWNM